VPRSTKNALALAALLCAGCLRSIAVGSLADAMSGSGDGYATDDDPELVRAAAPFGLKTMEQLAVEKPEHRGLQLALARGFTEYAYAFVQQDADMLEETDVARAREVRLRAKKLFLRGRDHGLRALRLAGVALPDGTDGKTWQAALAGCTRDDVAILYWTAAAWTLAIADGKDDMKLVGALPAVEAMMARALALDETWNEGAIHEFYVAYDGARSAQEGGGPDAARKHLDRARSLDGGKRLGPLVSFAESVLVASQDKAAFTKMLDEVVAFDVDRFPSERLANVIAQRRARWLLARTNDLFAQ